MKSSSTPTSTEEDGLVIVRVKPIGAGGGGVERSGIGMKDGEAALRWSESGRVDIVAGKVNGKSFDYMTHVIPPETDNEALHNFFMPRRIDAFLDGYNVNVMAYGQTGTGKTHTMFGTPGILERAGRGEYGTSIHPDYGLFPRSLLAIFERYKQLRVSSSNKTYVLTANALELSMMLGNQDLLNVKNKSVDPKIGRSTQYGVCIDRTAKPARMFGMEELTLESDDNLFTFLLGMSERCTSGTGQNQHSSRSHCFVTLTLYSYDSSDETLTKSRLQFVDLAGSEKMKNAHGNSDYRASSASVQGMLVNYSLTMLGCAVRDLVTFRKKQKKKIKSSSSSATEGGGGKKKKTKQFSFRNYMFDLIMLLSQSLTGEALTGNKKNILLYFYFFFLKKDLFDSFLLLLVLVLLIVVFQNSLSIQPSSSACRKHRTTRARRSTH